MRSRELKNEVVTTRAEAESQNFALRLKIDGLTMAMSSSNNVHRKKFALFPKLPKEVRELI